MNPPETDHTTRKQIITQRCAYYMGYTVCLVVLITWDISCVGWLLIHAVFCMCGGSPGAEHWQGNGQIRVVNSLRPRQNRRHCADNIFECNLLNENVWIMIKISLKFVPKGPNNNVPALVQIMAWRQTGDKPLSEPMMTQFNDAYMHHLASMS